MRMKGNFVKPTRVRTTLALSPLSQYNSVRGHSGVFTFDASAALICREELMMFF